MKVLIACEYSGTVREAFRKRGFDAWSCDLLPTEIPGQHIQGDVLKILGDGWDLIIAHPPCTHLAVSGARHFEVKRADGRQQEAIEFFMAMVNAPARHVAVEKPGLHYVEHLPQGGSNYSTLDVWTRRNKSNVPMAQKPAEVETDEHSTGPGAENTLNAAWP